MPKLEPLTKEPRYKTLIAGFDIETAGNTNEFVLACLVGDDLNETFYNKEDLYNYLRGNNKIRKYIIVATNLPFDFLGSFFNKKHWKVCERSGVVYKFTLQQRSKRDSIIFYDTGNYNKASVKKLGEIVGVPKMDHPKCFKRFPNNATERSELVKYCHNDAFISYKFYKERILYWAMKENIAIKSTIASMALDNFRRNYLNNTYYVSDYATHNKIFKAYYGGRTEIFKRGTFYNINCYDFNSLYPSVMINEFPDPNTVKTQKYSNKKLINEYEGVSYIEGDMPFLYIPCLPVRTDNKLMFPAGKIKGYYTHLELRHAIENGFEIHKYGKAVFYRKTCTPFKEYVLKNYRKRQQQKADGDPLEIMTKLGLNSLYGKWAYNYRESTTLIPANQVTFKMLQKAKGFSDFMDESFFHLSSTSKRPTSYSFPIWSAYCTTYARNKLFKYLGNPKLQRKIIYSDTDSIFLKDNKRIKCSDALGDMKHEYSCKEGIFVMPKFYDTIYPKIKGVKGLTKSSEFKKIIETKNITQEYFIKYRSAVKSLNHHKNGKLGINQIIERSKNFKLEDTKRFWLNKFDYTKQEDSIPILS